MKKIAPTPLHKFPMKYGRSRFLDVNFGQTFRAKKCFSSSCFKTFMGGLFKIK
jgi:hypothetical protein